MKLIRIIPAVLEYLVIALATLLFLINTVGCEVSNSPTRSSDSDSGKNSTNGPTSKDRTLKSQPAAAKDAPELDPKDLAEAEIRVKEETANLGQVRKELGELVKDAVETKKALLEAKLHDPQSDNKESEASYGSK